MQGTCYTGILFLLSGNSKTGEMKINAGGSVHYVISKHFRNQFWILYFWNVVQEWKLNHICQYLNHCLLYFFNCFGYGYLLQTKHIRDLTLTVEVLSPLLVSKITEVLFCILYSMIAQSPIHLVTVRQLSYCTHWIKSGIMLS